MIILKGKNQIHKPRFVLYSELKDRGRGKWMKKRSNLAINKMLRNNVSSFNTIGSFGIRDFK